MPRAESRMRSEWVYSPDSASSVRERSRRSSAALEPVRTVRVPVHCAGPVQFQGRLQAAADSGQIPGVDAAVARNGRVNALWSRIVALAGRPTTPRPCRKPSSTSLVHAFSYVSHRQSTKSVHGQPHAFTRNRRLSRPSGGQRINSDHVPPQTRVRRSLRQETE